MEKQMAGRERVGDFAPKFAELNDDVLFGKVWSRKKELSLKKYGYNYSFTFRRKF